MICFPYRLVAAFVCTGVMSLAAASDFGAGEGFGNPDSTEKLIAEQRGETSSLVASEPLERWHDWKGELSEETGVSFGLDYSAVALGGNGMTEDDASSGMLRFFGTWDLIGRGTSNTGTFVWKVEQRHRYSSTPPSGFALGQLGYVGIEAPPFSDQEARVTNLFWRQRLNEGRTTITAGFLDATDYIDVYGLVSPWLHFMNFAFSTGSATIALPNDAALGLAVGTMLGEQVYLIGGLTDTNADPTDVFEGFDTFFDDREYFTSVELGWTPGQERLVLDNYHVTLWHKDNQERAGVPQGWGANVSFTRYVDDKWLPFLRAGWADDGGSLLQKSVSVGVGHQPVSGGNVLGFGVNWGQPNEDTFGPGLDDQYSAELFYRVNVFRGLAVTADVQYLKNPALNPSNDDLWLVGLRGRLAF